MLNDVSLPRLLDSFATPADRAGCPRAGLATPIFSDVPRQTAALAAITPIRWSEVSMISDRARPAAARWA